MTTEDLLKPRYKVIADFPDNIWQIGQILTPGLLSIEQCEKIVNNLSKFPNLFKKLEWWEERKEDEMPEYVKYKMNGKIEKLRIFTINWTSYISEYEPATKEEYENQKLNT